LEVVYNGFEFFDLTIEVCGLMIAQVNYYPAGAGAKGVA